VDAVLYPHTANKKASEEGAAGMAAHQRPGTLLGGCPPAAMGGGGQNSQRRTGAAQRQIQGLTDTARRGGETVTTRVGPAGRAGWIAAAAARSIARLVSSGG